VTDQSGQERLPQLDSAVQTSPADVPEASERPSDEHRRSEDLAPSPDLVDEMPGPGSTPGLPSGARVLAQASLILTGAALASRILGWIRLLVIGSQFGASRELDAYFAAFRIPDAIFQLVVAGALSAALIPVFQGYRAREQDREAWRLASSVINLVVIGLSGFSLLMAIFAPLIVPLVTPGFDAPTTELTIRMTRIMLLSPVFIGMGAVVSGILNSYEQFAIPAIAPLLYNLAIIAAAIVLAPLLGVEGLAVGVAIGSLAHLAIQLPSLARVGQRYDLTVSLAHPGVRRVAWLMGPRTLGLAAGQINFLVSTLLASSLPEGSVTAYNYAFQLMQVPVGVVGVSVAVALFPRLSRDAALGRLREVRNQLAQALRILLFVAAPLTAIMIVLREPLTAVFFQYGLFSAQSTSRTAEALLFFTLGLAAHTVVHVLARTFYALQNTRTPVLWAIVAVVLNVPLMAWLVGPMGVDGLALAMSITATIEVVGLLWAVRGRLGGLDGVKISASLVRAVIAATAAAALMFGGLRLTDQWFAGLLAHAAGRLLVLVLLSAAGIAIFLVVAAALRSRETGELAALLRSRWRRPDTAGGSS
jgi:putative peptidoglycan lipid II flippase